jgi:hypothetical protein
MVGHREVHMYVTREQLEAMKKVLRELPDPERAGSTTRAAGLRELAPLIREQKDRGYKLRDLAKVIEQASGVPCPYSSLKDAVAPRKGKRSRKGGVQRAHSRKAVGRDSNPSPSTGDRTARTGSVTVTTSEPKFVAERTRFPSGPGLEDI